jgi:hypothetical protein
VNLTKADKDWIESRLKAYALWGGKHTDQIEATTDDDVNAILQDDFASVAAAVETVRSEGAAGVDAVKDALNTLASTTEADLAGIAGQLARLTQGQADLAETLRELTAAVEVLSRPKA